MPTIRPSSTDEYRDCGRRAATGMFPKLIEGAGFSLNERGRVIGGAIGSAIHKGAAVALTEKLEHGTAAPVSVAIDAAEQELIERVKQGVQWDQTTPASPGHDTARRQVSRMTRALYDGVVPQSEPVLIEKRLEVSIPWATDWVVSGQLDALTMKPSEVEDHKSGVKMRGHSGQVGTYGRIARAHGHPIEKLSVNFVKRASIRKEQPPLVKVDLPFAESMNHAVSIWRSIIADYERFMVTGDPNEFPANPASMLCSPKYCRAHSTPFCRVHSQILGEAADV